jgi:hypothetical protein
MSGHSRLHALSVAAFVLVAGCATASPRVQVLGVEQVRSSPQQTLVVFVEVVNPSGRDLRLSRMEYRVHADSWFDSSGQVVLSREVGAGSSAVVEIPVPVDRPQSTSPDGEVEYTLEGKLFAREDAIERSWKVAVRGALGRTGDENNRVRVTVLGPGD